MAVVEIFLLVLAYTIIVIALFLEIICYKKNIETQETIAFTTSLLLLIMALTAKYFFQPFYSSGTTDILYFKNGKRSLSNWELIFTVP